MAGTVVAVAAPRPARATLILSYTETDLTTLATASGTFTDNVNDTNPAIGILSLPSSFAPLPGFVVNGSTEAASGIPGNPGTPDTLTSGASSVVNNSPDPIRTVVSVGATDFGPAALLAFTAGSGTFSGGAGGTIALKWFDDPTDTQGGTSSGSTPGNLIDAFDFTSTTSIESYSHNGGPFAVDDPNPFSMTLQFDFTLLPGQSLISRGQAEIKELPVVEPASMLLVASCLLVLGLISRARHRA